ncbi:carbon-nitrogen hydrolase family protein [Maribrevibacterium harenarium]|uniref:Carbon-nitrogen hydrolase family protein n=1 Tax=Maribrevibacterium harenarium TaxID=2589817 RepID=A0A501WRI0_9GAMM|nr:carbon-nitrogen hydrolase family protein [Maribrevibacterium harenarium]TPE52363.1 carbon-nitrogen hydrolase family protein [Maribrevibacterium harenarium]
MRIAAVQMTSTADWRANLIKVKQQVRNAVDSGARLVVLPENALLFDGPALRQFAESNESQLVLQELAQLAADLAIYLVVGAYPMISREDGSTVDQGRVRQSCLVFSPQGELVARYDKIHLFDVTVADQKGTYQESKIIEPGQIFVPIFAVDGIKVGLSICYDIRFPEFYRELAMAGAELILVPSAFTYKTGAAHWQVLLQARAIENQCYLLGIDQCGWHSETRQTYGHSMLVNPWGDVVAALGEDESVLIADLDLSMLQQTRQAMPVLQHRRIK